MLSPAKAMQTPHVDVNTAGMIRETSLVRFPSEAGHKTDIENPSPFSPVPGPRASSARSIFSDAGLSSSRSRRVSLTSFLIVSIKILALVLFCSLAAAVYNQSEGDVDHFKERVSSLRGYRYSAPLIYWLMYTPLIACGMSGETMNVLGGYLFGHLMGDEVYGSLRRGTVVAALICVSGTFAGGLVTFLLGRSFLRERAVALKTNSIYWRSLDNIVARYGVILVTALRFSPIVPFALLNLSLGGSALTMTHFLLSIIGAVPFCLFLVNLGANGRTGVREIWNNPFYKKVLIVGVCTTVILTAFVITILWVETHRLQSVEEARGSPLTMPLMTDEAVGTQDEINARGDDTFSDEEDEGHLTDKGYHRRSKTQMSSPETVI